MREDCAQGGLRAVLRLTVLRYPLPNMNLLNHNIKFHCSTCSQSHAKTGCTLRPPMLTMMTGQVCTSISRASMAFVLLYRRQIILSTGRQDVRV
jgi:hypothetical protein